MQNCHLFWSFEWSGKNRAFCFSIMNKIEIWMISVENWYFWIKGSWTTHRHHYCFETKVRMPLLIILPGFIALILFGKGAQRTFKKMNLSMYTKSMNSFIAFWCNSWIDAWKIDIHLSHQQNTAVNFIKEKPSRMKWQLIYDCMIWSVIWLAQPVFRIRSIQKNAHS